MEKRCRTKHSNMHLAYWGHGFADQEDAHSKWNCFKKAVSRSNLSMALLRLTLICILNSINSFLFFFGMWISCLGCHKKELLFLTLETSAHF